MEAPGSNPTSFPGSLFFLPKAIAFGGKKRDPENEVGSNPAPATRLDYQSLFGKMSGLERAAEIEPTCH